MGEQDQKTCSELGHWHQGARCQAWPGLVSLRVNRSGGPAGQLLGATQAEAWNVGPRCGQCPGLLAGTEGGCHWSLPADWLKGGRRQPCRASLPGLLVVVGEPGTGLLHRCRGQARARAALTSMGGGERGAPSDVGQSPLCPAAPMKVWRPKPQGIHPQLAVESRGPGRGRGLTLLEGREPEVR